MLAGTSQMCSYQTCSCPAFLQHDCTHDHHTHHPEPCHCLVQMGKKMQLTCQCLCVHAGGPDTIHTAYIHAHRHLQDCVLLLLPACGMRIAGGGSGIARGAGHRQGRLPADGSVLPGQQRGSSNMGRHLPALADLPGPASMHGCTPCPEADTPCTHSRIAEA